MKSDLAYRIPPGLEGRTVTEEVNGMHLLCYHIEFVHQCGCGLSKFGASVLDVLLHRLVIEKADDVHVRWRLGLVCLSHSVQVVTSGVREGMVEVASPLILFIQMANALIFPATWLEAKTSNSEVKGDRDTETGCKLPIRKMDRSCI